MPERARGRPGMRAEAIPPFSQVGTACPTLGTVRARDHGKGRHPCPAPGPARLPTHNERSTYMTTLSPAGRADSAGTTDTERRIAAAEAHSAHNYHPLPVVISSAAGAWMTDVEGRRYLDMLAGYSALNFGHGHPRLIAAAKAQLDQVTLTSRAFHHDRFGEFCAALAELCGMEMVLPMNTGAEAVETAIKTARKWGYQVKGVPDGKADIVVAAGNFHGRTTTIVSFSTDPEARADFGPYTPGFTVVPYGDLAAMAAAVTDRT